MLDADRAALETEHWLCPPRAVDVSLWTSALASWSETVRSLTSLYADAPSAFGLELRTAYFALERAGTLPPADNDYWRDKVRILFMRPAAEPIAGSFARRLDRRGLDHESVVRTVSLLAGTAQRFRDTRAGGSFAHGRVEFEPVEVARSWVEILGALHRGTHLGTDLPVYLYARTIMAHPFTDANGRLARLLFAWALGRQLDMSTACIALTPSFYRFAESLSGSVTMLSRNGEWEPLTMKLVEIVEDAIALTKLVRGAEPGEMPGSENKFGNLRQRL